MKASTGSAAPRVLVVYHFFHPDDVVSARLFSELAVGLDGRGWEVSALTSNRVWGDPKTRLPARERWRGVAVERVHRPAWDQARPVQRLGNSAWMVGAWFARAKAMGTFDAVVLGSDPAFAPTLFIPLRRLWPQASLVHWSYDLYPEAIVADGGGGPLGAPAAAASALMRMAYHRCDAVVDLGPCMRSRLARYGGMAERHTIAPWALVEPPDAPRPADQPARERLFGKARLGLLYSGTLGRAHEFETFLELARACRAAAGDDITFCFASRGHRAEELRAAVGDGDTNVRLAPFSDERELAVHLEAADIHLLSLRSTWSGLVVPSKFFGSLAVGRPVLYAGDHDSDVGRWIESLGVGRVVTPTEVGETVRYLSALAAAPEALRALQHRARRAYDEEFRREIGLDRWDALLRRLARRPQRAAPPGPDSNLTG